MKSSNGGPVALALLTISIATASIALAREEYRTYSVLELGNPKDGIELIAGFQKRKAENTTPDDKNFNQRLDFKPEYLNLEPAKWFPGFDKAPAPKQWIQSWCKESPQLIYLSGHFAGTLFNDAMHSGDTAKQFELSFDQPGRLKVTAGDAPSYELDSSAVVASCRAVIVVGCSIVSLPARDKVQAFFTPTGGVKPLILGFHGTCPREEQDKLIRRFVANLPIGLKWSDDEVIKAYFKAASDWKEVAEGVRRHVGFVGRNGKAYVPDKDWSPKEALTP